MDETTIGFRMRGIDGELTVRYGTNDNPVRWGYDVLEIYSPDFARGFPVVEGRVSSYPAEGYAAQMGWLQLVRYEVADTGEHVTVFDVPPQISGTDTPFLAFGVRPTMFDAPSFVDVQNVTWSADTFLVYAPDAVLTRHLVATCGFRWGYDVVDGIVEVRPLIEATEPDWARNLDDLRARFPTWVFAPGWDRA